MKPVTTLELRSTLAWLQAAVGDPVREAWVPGASPAERRSLRALGAVAAHATTDSAAPEQWPAEIRQWLNSADPLPCDIAAELDIAIKESPDEALAWLYASMVASQRRRVLGTFFTPAAEVQPMLELWDRTQAVPTHIIDVGAGVGVFTAAAAQRWGMARVSSVDVNPVTLGLLGARMTQPDVETAKERVSLVLDDFTSWLPTQRAVPGQRRLILGNPPYTRGQLIPTAMRARLVEATEGLSGARASLSAFITALSLKHLEPDDGLCLLLPAQWLESEYAEPLRQRLLDLRHRRVELRLAPSELFTDATVDAVVLMVGTEQARSEPFVVAGWEDADRLLVDRADATTAGWRTWFAAPVAPRTRLLGTKKLRDVAVVRRGTATGANEFFLLSDDMLDKSGLPSQAVTPVVRRLAPHGTKVTANTLAKLGRAERRWLLRVTNEATSSAAVAAYIAHGVESGFDLRHLCQVRPHEWYDLSNDLVVPDVIVTAMTRGGVRIVANDVGAAITNNLYGWRWREDVTKRAQKAILTWLRGDDGQQAMLSLARSQGDGLYKVEPRALADLDLPGELFL
jgi:hypothetical protein